MYCATDCNSFVNDAAARGAESLTGCSTEWKTDQNIPQPAAAVSSNRLDSELQGAERVLIRHCLTG